VQQVSRFCACDYCFRFPLLINGSGIRNRHTDSFLFPKLVLNQNILKDIVTEEEVRRRRLTIITLSDVKITEEL
jgi:hypothetical protein